MPKRCVLIIGLRSCQGSLLAKFVHDHTESHCEVVTPDELSKRHVTPGTLIMVDYDDFRRPEPFALLDDLAEAGVLMALLNVDDTNAALDQLAKSTAVKGIFPRGTSPEMLLKGIGILLQGEYWLPRKLLSDRLRHMQSRNQGNGAHNGAHDGAQFRRLTKKESQVLILLAGGNTNADIARKLYVSPHTVKTHLYNLYRKIKASNRAQAVAWSMQHGPATMDA